MAKGKYYKHPTYGHVYGESTVTPRGRMVWPSLVTPKEGMQNQDGTKSPPRFETTFLYPKGNLETQAFIKDMEMEAEGMLALFNNGRSAQIAAVTVVKDGDEMDLEKYPFYAGCWYITARNQQQPNCFGPDKTALDPKGIEGGMEGRGVVTPLMTAHGLSYKLTDLQLTKDDGARFGGGVRDTGKLLDVVEEAAAEEENAVSPEPIPAEEKRKTLGAGRGKQAAVNLL